MTADMRKISVNVGPPSGQMINLEDVQHIVEEVISEGGYQMLIEAGQIALSWYTATNGVSAGVNFSVLEGVDLARDVVITLRKRGYDVIGVAVGY